MAANQVLNGVWRELGERFRVVNDVHFGILAVHTHLHIPVHFNLVFVG